MKKSLPAGRRGTALLLVIFIIAAFLFMATLFAKIVYNGYASANANLVREQAFSLAEAGLEKGKVELTHNPNWFTDFPYYHVDDIKWLTHFAAGSRGSLGEGYFKIVRERGKNRLYAIGYKGNGVVILKATFSTPPFKTLKWQEL